MGVSAVANNKKDSGVITSWEINGCVIEKKDESQFLVKIENEYKRVWRTFRDAFIFASSPEAEEKLMELKLKKENKQKLAKSKKN